MSNRDLIKSEIDVLPDDIVDFIYNFLFLFKQYKITPDIKFIDNTAEGYNNLLKFKGTLKRDVNIKKERLEYLDEKYKQ